MNLTTNEWVFSGSITGPYVTALAHDSFGNTSEFSPPLLLGTTLAQRAFVPLVAATN